MNTDMNNNIINENNDKQYNETLKQNKNNFNSGNSTIPNIDEEIHHNDKMAKIKKRPIVYAVMIVLAVIMGVIASRLQGNENFGFGFSFIAFTLSAIGALGLLIPKKVLSYIPTKERVFRKQYYIDSKDKEFVMDHLKKGSLDVVKLLENEAAACAHKNDGSATIKVIIYYTHSGSFLSSQIHEYIPYEFIPKTPSISFTNEMALGKI